LVSTQNPNSPEQGRAIQSPYGSAVTLGRCSVKTRVEAPAAPKLKGNEKNSLLAKFKHDAENKKWTAEAEPIGYAGEDWRFTIKLLFKKDGQKDQVYFVGPDKTNFVALPEMPK
jgi:hypothetical protein